MTATSTRKVSKSSTGAPSQLGQSSRKGKKAWRKHVDVGEVESGLEEVRAEERETGSSLRSKVDEELFQIDVKGDDNIRKHLPKFDKSELSYVKRLSQRSAVPAVFSRPITSSSTTKRHIRITAEDKKRLLRIGKRKQLGPFNSVQDPTEVGRGSAILDPTHAVKQSGTYDIWTASSIQDHPDSSPEKEDFLTLIVEKPSVKPPPLPDLRKDIAIPAVIPPHEGASYNPPVAAHQELLRIAHKRAEEKEKDAESYAILKEKIEKAKKAQWSGTKPGVPIGMQVDNLEDPGKDEVGDEETGEQDLPPPKKPPVRKTKQQRKKAEKLRAEKRALAERLAQKRYLSSLPSIKSTRKSIERALSTREQARIQRRLLLAEKLRHSGMAGKRIGKHVVPEGETEVQLGEDLSESLRGLKVEGNLFRDRFLSLQHRALLEPRVPVMPKKHRPITKEVEKFAWKRFE